MTSLPSDYDGEDGFGDDGLEKCPYCDKQLGGETGHNGEVYDSNGRRYDHLLNTEPGSGPFFCPECWSELEANQKASENQSLGDFA